MSNDALTPRVPKAKKDYDAAANLDIDDATSGFYEGITVTNLDGEEFETFWDALAAKNKRHFSSSDEAEAGSASGFPLLASGGFDASSLLPGFGLISVDIPPEEAEQKVKKLLDVRLNHQEMYRRTMELCRTPMEFSEVERAIEEFPEFELASQSPYRFIVALVNAGGLRRISLDDQGEAVTLADVEGLSEDEIDDKVACYVLETTETGRAAADELAPQRKLRRLLEQFPDRATVYRDLLSHVKSTPCNYEGIEKLFEGRDFSGLRTIGMEKHVALKPSVFVNNMEKAGGLVWKNGRWTITKEGEALLGQLIEKGSMA